MCLTRTRLAFLSYPLSTRFVLFRKRASGFHSASHHSLLLLSCRPHSSANLAGRMTSCRNSTQSVCIVTLPRLRAILRHPNWRSWAWRGCLCPTCADHCQRTRLRCSSRFNFCHFPILRSASRSLMIACAALSYCILLSCNPTEACSNAPGFAILSRTPPRC